MAHDAQVIQCIYNHPRLEEPRRLAQSFVDRVEEKLPSEYWEVLAHVKKEAVAVGDQMLAKACWCLESIGLAQDHFVSAFSMAREDDFYGSWCALEQAEVKLHFLREHFPIEDETFGLNHINTHVPRFQALFPYKLFISPGMIVRKATCSICQEPFKLRGGCHHVVGQIYDGRMCSRLLTDVKMLEVSLVDTPVQKYSVLFGPEITYDYGPVRYVISGLRSPWHGWNFNRSEAVTATEGYSGTRRNERCPCGSQKKYKTCCQRKERKKVHFDIDFEYIPPPTVPAFLEDARFLVQGPPEGLRGSPKERPSMTNEDAAGDLSCPLRSENTENGGEEGVLA